MGHFAKKNDRKCPITRRAMTPSGVNNVHALPGKVAIARRVMGHFVKKMTVNTPSHAVRWVFSLEKIEGKTRSHAVL